MGDDVDDYSFAFKCMRRGIIQYPLVNVVIKEEDLLLHCIMDKGL